MSNIVILAIFEDVAQRDFHVGLFERAAADAGCRIQLEIRRTNGCRFDYLVEHIAGAVDFDGVLVGVDGEGHSRDAKVALLEQGVGRFGFDTKQLQVPLLWSVAAPSIEEWLMADPEALPEVIAEELRVPRKSWVQRPGRARSARTAKDRLRDWATDLAGFRPLRGGREYAEQVGCRVRVDRLSRVRNGDLCQLIHEDLPTFFGQCVS